MFCQIYCCDLTCILEVLFLFVKFECPYCINNCISLSTDNEEIAAEDKDKLTSYLSDHIEVNDIFFMEELINDVLKSYQKQN